MDSLLRRLPRHLGGSSVFSFGGPPFDPGGGPPCYPGQSPTGPHQFPGGVPPGPLASQEEIPLVHLDPLVEVLLVNPAPGGGSSGSSMIQDHKVHPDRLSCDKVVLH